MKYYSCKTRTHATDCKDELSCPPEASKQWQEYREGKHCPTAGSGSGAGGRTRESHFGHQLQQREFKDCPSQGELLWAEEPCP